MKRSIEADIQPTHAEEAQPKYGVEAMKAYLQAAYIDNEDALEDEKALAQILINKIPRVENEADASKSAEHSDDDDSIDGINLNSAIINNDELDDEFDDELDTVCSNPLKQEGPGTCKLEMMVPSPDSIAPLLDVLRLNDGFFTCVDLDNNNLDDESLQKIEAALASNASLNALYLTKNAFGKIGTNAVIGILNNKVTPLVTLSIADNEIDDNAANLVMDAASGHPTLQELDVAYNAITHIGVVYMEEKLGNIKKLVLQGNNIGDEGAASLGRILGKNTSLNSLFLENCGISNGGGNALIEGLKNNFSLTSIDLAQNVIREILMGTAYLLCEQNLTCFDKSAKQFYAQHYPVAKFGLYASSSLQGDVCTLIYQYCWLDTVKDQAITFKRDPELFTSKAIGYCKEVVGANAEEWAARVQQSYTKKGQIEI